MTEPETRAFKIHPKLLHDVIRRQAGSLTKALCEGVMNSIDAGAKRIDLTLSETEATISDDGIGFRSREEIERFFETFGQPHEEGDAVYGTFRMGRGQMFSFGINEWRSGAHRMVVDIKGRGLDYDLSGISPPVNGCRIKITLYQPLSLLSLREVADDLRQAVRYVPVPVRLNKDLLTRDPAKEKWDAEDADAYYRFRQGRLQLYNLGVFVNDHRSRSVGVGGTVVSKRQLHLNFARNDVLAGECPVWQRIARVLRRHADTAIARKGTALNIEERALLARRLRSGDLGTMAMEAPVFRDVTGRWHTLKALLLMAFRYNKTMTSAAKGVTRGESVMRSKMAVVLDESNFDDLFGVSTLDGLVAQIIVPTLPQGYSWPYKSVSLDRLAPDRGDLCRIVPPDEYTPQEAIAIEVCGCLSPPGNSSRRRIVLGESKWADGWTDGASYIAINRKFLDRQDLGAPATWTALAVLLLHEYCHADASSSDTHAHSPEFYEQFHDAAHPFVSKAVEHSLKLAAIAIRRAEYKVRRMTLKALDQTAHAAKAGKALSEALRDAAAKIVVADASGTVLAALPVQKPKKPRKREHNSGERSLF